MWCGACNWGLFELVPLLEGKCTECTYDCVGSYQVNCSADGNSATLIEYSSNCKYGTIVNITDLDNFECRSTRLCSMIEMSFRDYHNVNNSNCSGSYSRTTLYIASLKDECMPYGDYFLRLNTNTSGLYADYYLDEACNHTRVTSSQYTDGICEPHNLTRSREWLVIGSAVFDYTWDYNFDVGLFGAYSNTQVFGWNIDGCRATATWTFNGTCANATVSLGILKTDSIRSYTATGDFVTVFINGEQITNCLYPANVSLFSWFDCVTNREIFIADSLRITLRWSHCSQCHYLTRNRRDYFGYNLYARATVTCDGSTMCNDFQDLNTNALDFVLQLDDTSRHYLNWTIENDKGNQVLSDNGTFYSDNRLVTKTRCVPDGCYTVKIVNSREEGLQGDAYFDVLWNNATVTFGKQSFDGGQAVLYFCSNYIDDNNKGNIYNNHKNNLTILKNYQSPLKITNVSSDDHVIMYEISGVRTDVAVTSVFEYEYESLVSIAYPNYEFMMWMVDDGCYQIEFFDASVDYDLNVDVEDSDNDVGTNSLLANVFSDYSVNMYEDTNDFLSTGRDSLARHGFYLLSMNDKVVGYGGYYGDSETNVVCTNKRIIDENFNITTHTNWTHISHCKMTPNVCKNSGYTFITNTTAYDSYLAPSYHTLVNMSIDGTGGTSLECSGVFSCVNTYIDYDIYGDDVMEAAGVDDMDFELNNSVNLIMIYAIASFAVVIIAYCSELWCLASFSCMFAAGAFIYGDATMSVHNSYFEELVVYGSMVVMDTELVWADLGDQEVYYDLGDFSRHTIASGKIIVV